MDYHGWHCSRCDGVCWWSGARLHHVYFQSRTEPVCGSRHCCLGCSCQQQVSGWRRGWLCVSKRVILILNYFIDFFHASLNFSIFGFRHLIWSKQYYYMLSWWNDCDYQIILIFLFCFHFSFRSFKKKFILHTLKYEHFYLNLFVKKKYYLKKMSFTIWRKKVSSQLSTAWKTSRHVTKGGQLWIITILTSF